MRRAVLLALPGLLALALPLQAAVFTVTKTADTLDGACDQDCSLREAVSAANAADGVDVVQVPAGIYTLSRTGAGEDGNSTGDLDTSDELLLVGAGAGSTILDGFGADRVLHLRSDAEIYGVTIRNGKANGAGGGIYIDPLNTSTTILHHSVVQENRASEDGGGIYAGSALVVRESAVLDNRALGGGGIHGKWSLRLTNVTVSGNSAETSGGGLTYPADAEVTISGSTIAFNYAVQTGGGIYVPVLPYLGVEDASLIGSIVAENVAATDPDCSREGSLGYNVIGVAGSCYLDPTDKAGTAGAPLNARLGVARDRLGATPVHILLPGSPAVGLVPASACLGGDQVGQARSVPCEAGAWDLVERPVCVPGGPVLCLQEGRFRVTAGWRRHISGGDAQADPLTDDTGNYWFFSPDNLEVMVKVLDGCGLNQRWWVFTSGLTDVGVDLKVEDLETGRVWTHAHPTGTTYAPVLDTDAFRCTAIGQASAVSRAVEPGPISAISAISAALAILRVTKTADTFDGACDHDCSLREAVAAANERESLSVIVAGPGVYRLTRPGAFEDLSATGDLDSMRPLAIFGAGAGRTILDGSGADRVLDGSGPFPLEVHGLTVRNGRAFANAGGGIRSAGPLTLVRSWVTANHSEQDGGGIFAGELEVRDSTVSGNFAGGSGGGLMAHGAALENATVSGNQATLLGGGVITFDIDPVLRNVTITGNAAGLEGGGLVVQANCDFACVVRLEMERTVIAGNAAPGSSADCWSLPAHTGAHNLFGIGDGCSPSSGDLSGTLAQPLDPRLTPLGDHGGPTPTHALLPDSPAVDLAPAASCSGTDQRGRPRPAGAGCDAGSVERLPACQPDEDTLCLGAGDRFQVTARWTAQGKSEAGKAVPLRLDSGAFWFFDPANVELTVKVLDGCGLNDRFWVFLTGLTDVGVEVTVEDLQTGRTWTHAHPAGTPLQPRLDTNALDSCSGS